MHGIYTKAHDIPGIVVSKDFQKALTPLNDLSVIVRKVRFPVALYSLLRLLNILELHRELDNNFAGIFVLRFLERQELTMAVQLILDRQNFTVKPFSDRKSILLQR